MVSAESVAKATIPAACSRTLSRRAFSCLVMPTAASPSVAGSATRRSCPVRTSSTHRQVTGSPPSRLRRNARRLPSGEIWNERGTPRLNWRVLACCRGKLSVMPMILPRTDGPPKESPGERARIAGPR